MSSGSWDWNKMENLPEEMVEEISRYLTVKDIISCTAVSRIWRALFDQNTIWKRHCRQDQEEYLRTTPCTVEPAFKSPESASSTLTPICQWRLAYMRENHLWENWRTGNFTSKAVIDYDPDAGHEENCSLHYVVHFYKEHYLVKIFKQRIEIWDVRAHNPIKISQTTLLFEWNHHCFIKSSFDLLLLTKQTQVQVFKINSASMSVVLKNLFYFDESLESPSNQIRLSEKVLQDKFPLRRIAVVSVGKYFFGVSEPVEGNSFLHIWNLESGLKIKEEMSPKKNGWKIINVEAKECSKDLLITCAPYSEHKKTMKQDVHEEYFYCIYSYSRLVYYPFIKSKISDRAVGVLYKNYILCYDSQKLTIDNYKTSQEIFTISLTAFQIDVLDCGFLVMDDTANVYTFNISDFSWTSHKFEKLMWFHSLSGNFVRMQFQDPELLTCTWEFGSKTKKTQLYLPTCEHLVKPNRSGTRLLLNSESVFGNYALRVRCFW
ncbi:hypothetical protein J6590_052523 [Homalodisca vitripennis]|nr:hypothetical protein J6590_052523 [Homalodisca vitripennis]